MGTEVYHFPPWCGLYWSEEKRNLGAKPSGGGDGFHEDG